MKAAIATNTNTTTQVPILLRKVPISAINYFLKSRKFNPDSLLEKYTVQKDSYVAIKLTKGFKTARFKS
jgi:hypothetical protein